MDATVKLIVTKNVTFNFDSKGKLTVNGQVASVRKLMGVRPGLTIAQAKIEIQRATAELVSLGFGELIARQAWSAGVSHGRNLAAENKNVGDDQPSSNPNANKHLTPNELKNMTRIELIRYGRELGLAFEAVKGLRDHDQLVATVLGRQSSIGDHGF